MNILVTGGAGFIGSHCVDALLALGWDVTILDNFSTGRESNLKEAKKVAAQKRCKLKLVRGSIGNPKLWAKLPRHDVVLHFAGRESDENPSKNWEADFENSVSATKPLLSWILRKKVKGLLYASSARELYGQAQTFPTDERAPISPMDPKGAAKAFFEIYLSALCKSLRASGHWSTDPLASNFFSWASLRFSDIYGPRQKIIGEAGLIPRIIETLSKGKAPELFGEGEKTSDYLHVDDAVAGVLAAVAKISSVALADSFNVASGTELRDIEVFENVKHIMHELGNDPDAPKPLHASLKVSKPKCIPLRPGEVTRRFFDSNKIELYLGWRPRKRFEEGVRSMLNEFFGLPAA